MQRKTNSLLQATMILFVAAVGMTSALAQNSTLTPTAQRHLAPELKLPDQSNKILRLSDYRGQVILLDFWATSCAGCREEIPWYVDFETTYGHKGLAVLGVSVDMSYDSLSSAQQAWNVIAPFARQIKMNYPIVLGNDQATSDYSVYSYPATFLIDANGRIAASYIGVVVDKKSLEQNIVALLGERKSKTE